MAQGLARLQAWFKDPSQKLPPPEPIIDDLAVTSAIAINRALSFASTKKHPMRLSRIHGYLPAGPDRVHRTLWLNWMASVSRPSIFLRVDGRCSPGRKVVLGWRMRRHAILPTISTLRCDQWGTGVFNKVQQQWAATYKANEDGAVLIRPDGFVAWRARESNPDSGATLRRVFGEILMSNT
jgi:putative polyketide hydroxylase